MAMIGLSEQECPDGMGDDRRQTANAVRQLSNVNYDCRLTTINFAGALPHEKLNY
jgi:hypothetical protein